MNPPDRQLPGEDEVAGVAADWVLRLDRGLSPEEQDSYLQWLAASPRHAEAIAVQRRAWEAFDRLAGLQSAVEAAPDPDLLAPHPVKKSRRRVRLGWGTAIAVAAVALVVLLRPSPIARKVDPAGEASALAAEVARLAPIEERTLSDGSMLRLNRGAEVEVAFSAGERRVRLVRGEAAFSVAHDSARPFVVSTDAVVVRALGTVFNVRRDPHAVDVIVTEGRVLVAGTDPATAPTAALPTIAAGQRAVVPLEPMAGPPTVVTPPAEELTRRLAWQPRMLAFTDEPLAVILNEFNRHNPILLRIDDPALQQLRLTARFRSDNVPGFLRLLVSDFRVTAHPQSGGEIALRYSR